MAHELPSGRRLTPLKTRARLGLHTCLALERPAAQPSPSSTSGTPAIILRPGLVRWRELAFTADIDSVYYLAIVQGAGVPFCLT
jgi:hypothetical protein